MPQRTDLTGQKFGTLTVIGFSHTANRRRQYWLCKCDCGNEKIITSDSLRRGTKSCGCLVKELVGRVKYKHGMYKTSEFGIWGNIIARCTNPNHTGFYKYGMRGISICDRWLHSFENFYADMGARPSPKHSIDRKNNNGNYEPSNCRWATRKEQSRNKRNNRWMEYNGRRMIMTDWQHELGIGRTAIPRRLKNGYSDKEAIEYYINKNAMKCKININDHN